MKLPKLFRSTLSQEEKRKVRKEWLLAVVSGIFMGISFPPITLHYFMFVGLVPLLIVCQNRRGLGAVNRITYLFGFVFTAITLYWVGSWQPETDPFLMISGVALLFFNPILFLIPSTLFHLSRKFGKETLSLLLLPAFWVTYEYVYSITDLRFPWLILGHGLAEFKSFIQIAEIVGANGLSILVVFINVLITLFIVNFKVNKKRSFVYLTISLSIFLFVVIYGNIRLNNYKLSGKKVKIGLVQPNLDPWKKWDAGNLSEQLDLYLNLSKQTIDNGAEIVVWPETALPVYFLSGSYFPQVQKLRDFTKENNVPVLTGMPHATFYRKTDKYPEEAKPLKHSDMLYTSYNSILLFDPNKEEVKQYGKIKLVPFGELVPFMDVLPILSDLIRWNVGISSWNVGKEIVVFNVPYNINNQHADTLRTAGVICIESIYPDFVAEFVQKGAQLIAVVTNDSWYGDSSGPYQHKEIGVLRAVENRRSVVRAANGGISCLIDPLGNILVQTKMYTRDAITVDADIESGKTFFTNHPLLFVRISYVISIIVILIFLALWLKEKIKKGKSNE